MVRQACRCERMDCTVFVAARASMEIVPKLCNAVGCKHASKCKAPTCHQAFEAFQAEDLDPPDPRLHT